jgi:hypothetical protein
MNYKKGVRKPPPYKLPSTDQDAMWNIVHAKRGECKTLVLNVVQV